MASPDPRAPSLCSPPLGAQDYSWFLPGKTKNEATVGMADTQACLKRFLPITQHSFHPF